MCRFSRSYLPSIVTTEITNTPKAPTYIPLKSSGAHANSAVCKFLIEKVRAVAHLKGPQEIAAEMGYSRPNYFLMILNGDTKLPLDKVPLLAKALQVDAKLLFRLAPEAHSPELRRVVEEIYDQDPCSPLASIEPQ